MAEERYKWQCSNSCPNKHLNKNGPKTEYNIINIHRGSGDKSHLIYGEVVNEKNELIISATLDYVMKRMEDLIH